MHKVLSRIGCYFRTHLKNASKWTWLCCGSAHNAHMLTCMPRLTNFEPPRAMNPYLLFWDGFKSFWFNLSYTKKIFFPSSSSFQFLHLKNTSHDIFYVYRIRSGGRLLGVLEVYCFWIVCCFDAGGRPFLYSGGTCFLRTSAYVFVELVFTKPHNFRLWRRRCNTKTNSMGCMMW